MNAPTTALGWIALAGIGLALGFGWVVGCALGRWVCGLLTRAAARRDS